VLLRYVLQRRLDVMLLHLHFERVKNGALLDAHPSGRRRFGRLPDGGDGHGGQAAARVHDQLDSWCGKLGTYVVDALLTGLGWVPAVIAGLVITVFMLMEGFTGLGLNMLLVAMGPVCVAFAAHGKTESYFWGFLKAYLFIGLLYMPLAGEGRDERGSEWRWWGSGAGSNVGNGRYDGRGPAIRRWAGQRCRSAK
jgi:hypothetical protein